jgi:ABC-type bacteriocin/lantibiotic exporter with double-glycine peptidase domain
MIFAKPSRRSQDLARVSPLPISFYAFVLRSGGWHQLLLCFLSIAVFLLNAAPIELQRRIIDMAVKGGPASAIMTALLVNCAVILSFGLIKLLMNIYRAWLGECATRTLRLTVDRSLFARTEPRQSHAGDGTGLSMILAEADDVGAFVGSSISVPIVEAGFLISVFLYLARLDSAMMLLSLVVLASQFLFVPIMQKAINRRVADRTLVLRQLGDGLVSPLGIEAGAPLDAAFSLAMGIFKLKFSLNFLMNLSYSLGNVLVLGIGSLLVLRGQLEIATVVTFVSAMSKVVDPWNDMVDWARNLAVTRVKYRLIVDGCSPMGDDPAAPGRAPLSPAAAGPA